MLIPYGTLQPFQDEDGFWRAYSREPGYGSSPDIWACVANKAFADERCALQFINRVLQAA